MTSFLYMMWPVSDEDERFLFTECHDHLQFLPRRAREAESINILKAGIDKLSNCSGVKSCEENKRKRC